MTAVDLVTAGLYLLPALVWATIARQLWAYRATGRPRSGVFLMAPIVATVIAANFFLQAAWATLPGGVPRDPWTMVASPTHVVREVSWLASLALLRHLLRLNQVPEDRPPGRWLAVNYAIAALVAAVDMALRLRPGATAAQQMLGHRLYELGFTILGALCLWQVVRTARPGRWGPEHAGELRRPDLVLIAVGVAAAFLAVPIVFVAGGRAVAVAAYEVILGLVIAAPFALRMLGFLVPELLVTAALLGGTGGLLVAHVLAVTRLGSEFQPLLLLATVLGLTLVVTPGQAWLRARINRLILRRSLRQHEELRAFLHTLPPEIGPLECCRRALAELVRVRQLKGAAVILRDGEPLVHGTFDLAPLARVWPRGAAADVLPARSFGTAELRELPLPLRDALIEANVGLGTLPILSPRRRWGHLFMNTGFLGGSFRDDDVYALEAFTAQLALVLDGADLLARAVAVERSLAHAEKLAAIGETAARIAHDIRNPVAAARSLAQQLAREPASPLNAEHAELILAELERVERRVAALLRFSRREEFRLDLVDLGALAREALAAFMPRLRAAGVDVHLEAPGAVTARADAEKLRQVLVNLIENAADALADGAQPKRLRVGVGLADGNATLSVTDTGGGVPPEALPRLFEPFFSLKEGGTGLGLAIAKRTIDAHGGRIAASVADEGGMTFQIDLPHAAAER
jgi:signal transduction histidine kinase